MGQIRVHLTDHVISAAQGMPEAMPVCDPETGFSRAPHYLNPAEFAG